MTVAVLERPRHLGEHQPGTGPPLQDGRARAWHLVLAVVAAVVTVDQAAKWWAWRHVAGALVNVGGDPLVSDAVGRLFAGRATGAVLDVLDAGLLAGAAAVLANHRLTSGVRVTGALVLAGWTSNLLDRLGLHVITAPGSARGAVDFVPVGTYSYNVADLVIIMSTPLFLLAVAVATARRVASRSAG